MEKPIFIKLSKENVNDSELEETKMSNPIFKIIGQNNNQINQENPMLKRETFLEDNDKINNSQKSKKMNKNVMGMINNNINFNNNMNDMMKNQNNNIMSQRNMMMNQLNNMNNMGMNKNNIMMNKNLEHFDGEIYNNKMTGMNPMMSQDININQSMGMMMDEDEIRLKEIIKPYEDKIKEQEETIRKNNFNLLLLKEKLIKLEKHYNKLKIEKSQMMMNNYKNNNMNNNLNKSMINNMNENVFDNDIIHILFNYGKNIIKKIKCLKDELIESVINRFCRLNNLDRNKLNFSLQSPILNTLIPISEIGLSNNSIIDVFDMPQFILRMNTITPININNNIKNMFEFQNNLNNNNFGIKMGMQNNNLKNLNKETEDRVNLIFNYQGKKINIYLKENSTVNEALKKFLDKEEIKDINYKKINFIFNDKKLLLDDDTPLKKIFFGGIGNINVI